MKIKAFYEGKEVELEGVSTYQEAAKKLDKKAQFLACEVDGELKGLTETIQKDNFKIQFFDFSHAKGKEIYWHTSAHILAQAVKRVFPQALFSIGPSIENGFYYDFDLGDYRFLPEDAQKIENEAKKVIQENLAITRKEVSKKEALEIFKNNPYKTEIIQQLPDDAIISTYTQGDFTDLCRGPHLGSTAMVRELKIMSFAGAYWRGDSKNKMLQRVYGISFPSKKELDAYLRFLEESKERDHRKIGKELDFFSFHDEGPGFPFWHAKGVELFNKLVDYMRNENQKRGYTEIKTPPVLNEILWKKSGHWDNYKDNMYFTEIDEKTYSIKPMNCPGGLLVYNTRLHSYRELPIRQAEFGLVHRHELSGVLHGLFRVRSFTQDDAHIFCTPEQLQLEIEDVVKYTLDVYKTMGFNDFIIFIATRPDNSIGSDENWEKATESLIESLKTLGIEYKIKDKEGAFYGPKIEFNIKDTLGRNWQCGTVQVDFSMPERFDVSYEGSDGQKHRPIMVHRAILGSFERFVGILLEHYAGKLPVWLSPIQVRVINVHENQLEFSKNVEKRLLEAGLRVEGDYRVETLGYKIREGRNSRIPFLVILGDREQSEGNISVRNRENKTSNMKVEELISMVKETENLKK